MSSCESRVRTIRWLSAPGRCSRRLGDPRRSGRECAGSTRRATRTRPGSASPATTSSPSSGGSRRGEPVTRDDAVVVEPHQLDHVADVIVVIDPARRHRVLAGEDRVIDDPPLLTERGADLLAEAEMGRMIAVQVTDLAASDPEAPLAAPPVSGLDARPGRHLFGDDLVCSLLFAHRCLLESEWGRTNLQAQVNLKSRAIHASLTGSATY